MRSRKRFGRRRLRSCSWMGGVTPVSGMTIFGTPIAWLSKGVDRVRPTVPALGIENSGPGMGSRLSGPDIKAKP